MMRKRMDTENGASDDAERAQSASDELGQIVAGDIFDDFAAAGGESAIGKSDSNADDEIAEWAEAETEGAIVARGKHAADRSLPGPERIEGETLAVLCERGLQPLDGAAGFDANGEVGPNMLDDFIEASGGQNEIGALWGIAPGELGAAPTRDDGEACVISETKHCGKLSFVSRFEDEPRLKAANCISRSGRANRIGSQNCAEFVRDVERSSRHLRDSVHYNGSLPSRRAPETRGDKACPKASEVGTGSMLEADQRVSGHRNPRSRLRRLKAITVGSKESAQLRGTRFR